MWGDATIVYWSKYEEIEKTRGVEVSMHLNRNKSELYNEMSWGTRLQSVLASMAKESDGFFFILRNLS